MRARFGAVYRLDYYDEHALQRIVVNAAQRLQISAEEAGVEEIARRSRGTPAVALRLLRRVRDYAQVRAEGTITRSAANEAMSLLSIDRLGLDEIDRMVLETIIKKYDGGPVGLEHHRCSISEETRYHYGCLEPYLLQIGFLSRTSQGRMATSLAYSHLGYTYPTNHPNRV